MQRTLQALQQRRDDLTAAIAALEKLAAHHQLHPRPPLARIIEMPARKKQTWKATLEKRRRAA